MARWGVRYLIIAVGDLEDPATDEDVEAIHETLNRSIPFEVTALSDLVSDQLTIALLRERGVF